MKGNENQSVKSARERLIEKMQARYPDRDFTGANGVNGETGEDVLGESIFETLEELTAKNTESQEKNSALTKLFYSDPMAAEFVQKWLQSGDPRAALVETFGDDLSELSTEEGRGRFSQNLASWRERKSENDRLSAEADANWSKTLEDLESWGNDKGLDNDQKVAVIMRLVSVAANGLMNKYEPADFDMAYKEMNYDSAIETARREGEVSGRNARIEEARRRRQESEMMPPSLNGQGGRIRKPEEKSIFGQANELV